MLLEINHYYLVIETKTRSRKVTVAQYMGDEWYVIGSEVPFEIDELQPICEMIRKDGKEI